MFSELELLTAIFQSASGPQNISLLQRDVFHTLDLPAGRETN
jgi:hypothetical protein